MKAKLHLSHMHNKPSPSPFILTFPTVLSVFKHWLVDGNAVKVSEKSVSATSILYKLESWCYWSFIRQSQSILVKKMCRYEKVLYAFFFVCVFFYWAWGIKALFRNYIIQFLQQSSLASINNALRALTAEPMVLQRSVHPHSAADKLVLPGHLSQVDTSTKVFCGKVNYPFKSSFSRGLPDEVSWTWWF